MLVSTAPLTWDHDVAWGQSFVPNSSSSLSHHGFLLHVRGHPLRLAYATTFNSRQGLTLTRAAIDLRIDPFAHGQLYTALSRVRHRDDCFLIFSEENEERDSANVVYKSLLLWWTHTTETKPSVSYVPVMKPTCNEPVRRLRALVIDKDKSCNIQGSIDMYFIGNRPQAFSKVTKFIWRSVQILSVHGEDSKSLWANVQSKLENCRWRRGRNVSKHLWDVKSKYEDRQCQYLNCRWMK